MAEFALGLTKTAVKETVSRVKSAMEEEAKLRVRVQDDLVFITGEFEMMQSFLSASGTGERAWRHRVVRTWVRQLRDLAFDVEDCVEFIVHLDKASRWDWLRRLTVSVCMERPPLPLDLAVAEIKRLKARVEDVSQRSTRYNLMAADHSPADDARHQQLTTTYTTTGGSNSKWAAGAFKALLDVWKEAGKLTAIGLRKLIDSHVSELQVISLWRAGGDDARVGDHAPPPPNNYVLLLKQAYDDPEICRRFKNNRAWVKLSALQHPFDPIEFLNNMLTQFTSRHHHHYNHAANANTTSISELLLQLSQHRYLLVIEQELTTVADWDAIRMYLPDGNNGSRVVVSTNSLGIALVCTGDPHQVSQLKRFSHDRGIYAFFPKGCGHRSGMGEFIWQLRHCGVIFLFGGSSDDISKFLHELGEADNTTINKLAELDKARVLEQAKFEHCYWYNTSETDARKFNLVHMAGFLVSRSYPKDEKSSVSAELKRMSEHDIIERCRKLLTEHNYLIFIYALESITDWDLIKRQLLCESTGGCIVVITTEDNQSITTHCVDKDEYRALNLRGVMKGFDEQYHKVRGNTMEEGEYELVGYGDGLFSVMESVCGNVLAVLGIAGVGKTAYMRKLYNVKSKVYRMHGWVDVPNPFNLTELCRRLLLDFYSGDINARESAAIGMMEGQDPIQWCCEILREDRCLLVIDDLRSTQEWDMIKATLLSHTNSGTIFVITREESVARHCTDSKELIANVEGLKDDVALDLFNKIAMEGKQVSELDPRTEMVSKLLVSKCGGLPEVIVAIGKSVRAQDVQISWLDYLNYTFIETLEDFSEFPNLRGLFCWMQSYFDACSDELKPCIFYMSVFPADQRIRWSRLLRRCIAEGYSSGSGSSGGGGTAEEKGKKLLLELMELSILYHYQQTSAVKSYKLNGFFHEYIKSRPMEDNLVFALDGSNSGSSQLSGQHLTVSSSWERDSYAFSMIDFSRLRSLTVFGMWESFLISDKMKHLRVLDLEGTTSTSPGTMGVTDNDLDKIGKLLPRLKFLSLRGCMNITCLPDSMGDMRQLQTLDVRYTSIVELPSAITMLEKLQYIRAGTSTDTSLLILELQAKKSPSPPRPQEEDVHGGTSSPVPQAATTSETGVLQLIASSRRITEAWKRKAHDFAKSSRNSWWKLNNRLDLRKRRRVAANGGGVEVVRAAAEGIGRLAHLHTLGVVNVAGGGKKGASLFLEELKKLTQLRNLRLSGISCGNWHNVFSAISGHLHHLDSLSLRLQPAEEDGGGGGGYKFTRFDSIRKPSKTLRYLKVLYTTTGVRAVDAAHLRSVRMIPNLERFIHDLTISSQEDIDIVKEAAPFALMQGCRLRIKPIEEHIIFDVPHEQMSTCYALLDSLGIECSSTLSHSMVTFGNFLFFDLSAISIHCCCSSGTSDAELSSSCNLKIVGLDAVLELQEVTVTGTYANDLKRDLREQLDSHQNKPVLK